MKKIICIILSLAIVSVLFSACSNQEVQEPAERLITVDSHYADTDESVIRAYEKLCNAVIAGEKEVKFNTALTDDVYQLFYTCFPLYVLVDSIDALPDSSGVSVSYKNSDEEHLSLVNRFFDRLEEIKKACNYGNVNTDRYVFNVYTYITQNFIIDDSVLTAFDVIVNGRGYSAAICSAFEYIVLQGGGKAGHILNYTGSSNIMSFAEFKGKIYYFNPALDIVDNQGNALKGFAMNSDRTGNLQFYYTDEAEAERVTDNTFDILKNSKSFKSEGNNVRVDCGGDNGFLLEFN